MKKHISLFLVLTIVLSMVSIISHFDDPVSAGSTFCADSFAVTKADGTVVHEFGSNSNLGQLEDYVDDGAVNIHAAGWYLPESAMEDMGYQHDDGAITWGIAYVDSSIYGPLNSELPMRYRFDTPILEGTHTFRIVARLTSGKIVTAFETHYINGYSIVAEWVNINTGDDGAGLGLWLWAPGEYAAAAFTATDSFEGLCTPICWASRTGNDQPVTYEMLVYRFVNNIENSMSKTPLVRQEYAPIGDNFNGDTMEFDPLPGGQYVLAIRLLTVENGGYFVLPTNGNSEKAVYKTNVGDGTQTFNFGIKTKSNNSIFGVPPVITFDPVIAVSSADGYFGDEVTLEVAISNNPGIIAMSIDVNYDADVLELISAMPKDFNDMSFGPTANQPFKVTWDGSLSPNNTQNGVLTELKFAIKEGATLGDTAVTITYDEDNIFNSDYDNVAFDVSDGAVTVKEAIVDPIAPEITIAACNLSFQDNIYIKYAVKTDDLTAVKLLIWTAPQTEYVYGTQSAELTTIGTETVSGVQCAIFQYNKLAAKQMTDNVYARAFIEINGVKYYSEVKKYSILQYAYNKTGRTGTATTNQKLITLLNDMLQYGASAQNYLNYKTGRLATMDFYQVKVVGGVLSDMCDNGLYLTGESVVLAAPATNTEGLTFVCWQDKDGNVVGTEAMLIVTVGTANEVYTAIYGNVIDYSLFEFESNGDGTCMITGLNMLDSTEIVLPDTAQNGDVVTGIDAGAFASEEITVITIPATITSIGRNAFKGCELTDVYYLGTRAQWEAINIASGNDALSAATIHFNDNSSVGLAYVNNGDGTCSITGIGSCSDVDVVIPDEINGLIVTKISQSAFSDFTSLLSIMIPSSVTVIQQSAFKNCSNLSNVFYNGTWKEWENIAIGNNNDCFINAIMHTFDESIGFEILDNGNGTCTIVNIGTCTDLVLFIPHFINDLKVVAIGEKAFENEAELMEIHIPSTITAIETRAFYGCSGISELTIPNSVTRIGNQIVYKANNLNTIYYNASYWPSSATENPCLNNSNVKKIVFGGNTIASYAAVNLGVAGYIEEAEIKRSVTSIGTSIFYNAGNLKTVYYNSPYLPSSATSNPFLDIQSIKKVIFGGYSIGSYAARNLGLRDHVEEIELQESVLSIGDYAFYECSNLKKIVIPSNMHSIGINAFSSCPCLNDVYYQGQLSGWCDIDFKNCYSNPCCNKSFLYICDEKLLGAVIPGSVYNLKNTFFGCRSLESVTFSENVREIGENAFGYCINLSNVLIPDSIDSIGEYAFISCSNLEDIVIPDSVTKIDVGVFCGCINIKNISIPDSVTSIERAVFVNCSSIESVTIPDSVTYIGSEAFENCISLKTISLPSGITSIKYATFKECSSLISITLPNTIMEIAEYAFFGCSELKSILLPDTLSSVGAYAFADCSSLISLTFPRTVNSIGENVLQNANKLETVYYNASYWPSSETENPFLKGLFIEKIVFGGQKIGVAAATRLGIANYIDSIEIRDSVTIIEDSAFGNCTRISSITIPDSVTYIGGSAFYGCTSLEIISIPNGITCIEWGTFKGCTSLVDISLPASITSISQEAFYGCTHLNSISIPYGVEFIYYATFQGCSNLLEISLPESLKGIDLYAFCDCVALENIVIPNGVTSIGIYAFNNCTSLVNVVMPDSVNSIGRFAFNECINLVNIVIPNGVTCIENDTFKNCTNLVEVFLPASIRTIAGNAFKGCTNLSQITIPDGVTSIGQNAFSGCYSIISITIPSGVTRIENDTFSYSGLTSITISCSVTYIGSSAFARCVNLTDVYYDGTMSKWNDITFADTWNWRASSFYVHCIDGDVFVP